MKNLRRPEPMLFVAAETEPTIILMLTEQDCNDMRHGRTRFVDKTVIKGKMFNKVVVSLHRNQEEIEGIIRAAGHGALLKNMPSPVPSPEEVVCTGCQAIVPVYLDLDGKCIVCWREIALRQLRKEERERTENR